MIDFIKCVLLAIVLVFLVFILFLSRVRAEEVAYRVDGLAVVSVECINGEAELWLHPGFNLGLGPKSIEINGKLVLMMSMSGTAGVVYEDASWFGDDDLRVTVQNADTRNKETIILPKSFVANIKTCSAQAR